MTESDQRLIELEAVLLESAKKISEASAFIESLTPEQRVAYKTKLRKLDRNIRELYEAMGTEVPKIMRNELGRIGELIAHQATDPERN